VIGLQNMQKKRPHTITPIGMTLGAPGVITYPTYATGYNDKSTGSRFNSSQIVFCQVTDTQLTSNHFDSKLSHIQ
jgi:hypothetical protein